MAKVQTRKTVSLNKDTHARLVTQAATEGVSSSSVVEKALADKYGWPLPEIAARKVKPKRPPPSQEEIDAEREKVRIEMRRRVSVAEAQKAADRIVLLAKESDMMERRAMRNPCRKNKCRIEGLHEAHD